MSLLRHLPLLLALCLGAGLARATVSAAASPALSGWQAAREAAAVGLTDLRPLAPSRLRVWGFDVYDARLWIGSGFDPAHYERHRFALELDYLRRIEGHAIAERSLREMRALAGFSESQAQRWLQAMKRLFPNVEPGDEITGWHLPGEGVGFVHNGRLAGQIRDPEFARLFFGIWLSPATSQPRLREALLSGWPASAAATGASGSVGAGVASGGLRP